jgi:DNA-binding NarL/FixJ family response regulator
MSLENVYIVGEATGGRQAIEMMESCQPDVILMDSHMPNMNGIEATTAIKKSWKNVLIIGLCSGHEAYIHNAFLKAGASAVVSNDRIDDLSSAIQTACNTTLPPVDGS